MENSFIKMEVYIAECGKKIKWMVKVFYITVTESQRMTDNGKQINLMDLGFFIIKHLNN